MWKTMNYEVCGRGHEKTGIPCQDKTLAIDRNHVHVIALADGAGSARYSHMGAEVAINRISEFIADHFDSLINTTDGVKVKEEIHREIRNALQLEQQKLSCEYKDLASTLLLVAIKENQFIMIHVGDGVIGYVKNDQLFIASNPDNGEFANTTVFLTSSNVLASTKLIKGELNSISGFVLMSDGTAESFYHKQTKTLSPAVKKIINWTSILTSERMKSLISTSFHEIVKMNTQDDCSIAIIALSSNQCNEYFALPLHEKCELLGVNFSYFKNAIKQIERYDAIIQILKVPQTVKKVSKMIHLKPKYTKKKLCKLVEKGLIVQKASFYYIEEVGGNHVC